MKPGTTTRWNWNLSIELLQFNYLTVSFRNKNYIESSLRDVNNKIIENLGFTMFEEAHIATSSPFSKNHISPCKNRRTIYEMKKRSQLNSLLIVVSRGAMGDWGTCPPHQSSQGPIF